jgi:hypothetical protein
VSVKGEAGYLQKWMSKGEDKGLGKEPPQASEAPYRLKKEGTSAGGEFEQLNLKVPKGTKSRLKRLGRELGNEKMVTVFKRMLDEYEARYGDKRKG